jgi:predicted DNA-binding protein YlxM (UPF0122 family)
VAKASKSRKSMDEQRIRIASLIRVYGSLLTQRQLSLALQFCQEGKNFSQIARDREVSRQAVHEAIRSVQQQLELFEMKLRLVECGGLPLASSVEEVMEQIVAFRQKLVSGEFVNQQRALLVELDGLLQKLQESLRPQIGVPAVSSPQQAMTSAGV